MGREWEEDWASGRPRAKETEAGRDAGEERRGWGSLKAAGRRGATALSQGACAALRRCRRSGLGKHWEEELGFALPGRGELRAGHRAPAPLPPLRSRRRRRCSTLAAREGWGGEGEDALGARTGLCIPPAPPGIPSAPPCTPPPLLPPAAKGCS